MTIIGRASAFSSMTIIGRHPPIVNDNYLGGSRLSSMTIVQGQAMKCMACMNTRSPYSGKDGTMCPMHWVRLSLQTRRRWWKETGYGSKPPSADLRDTVVRELNR